MFERNVKREKEKFLRPQNLATWESTWLNSNRLKFNLKKKKKKKKTVKSNQSIIG